MASLRKRNGSWVLDWREGGKRRREVLGRDGLVSKREAGARLKETELELYRANGRAAPLVPSFGAFVREYLSWHAAECLANLHTAQAAVGKHATETEAQLWAEAQRTLRSVFSKPARQPRGEGLFKEEGSYLPNSLREAILAQRDGTAFLRVYEALLLLGLKAVEWLTEREIKARLSSWYWTAFDPQSPQIWANPRPWNPTPFGC